MTADSNRSARAAARVSPHTSMADHKRGIAAALVAIACAIALGACGGSGNSRATASSSLANAELKVAQCMRAKGVSTFPDPNGAGGGFNLNGTGIDPQSPLFHAAQQTCFKLLPGGGPSFQQPAAQRMAQALQAAKCMRSHGIASFPDPTLKPPPLSDRAAYSSVDDDGGIIFAIPRTIDPNSAAFKQAASACGL
jgi:hypothetical protein